MITTYVRDLNFPINTYYRITREGAKFKQQMAKESFDQYTSEKQQQFKIVEKVFIG